MRIADLEWEPHEMADALDTMAALLRRAMGEDRFPQGEHRAALAKFANGHQASIIEGPALFAIGGWRPGLYEVLTTAEGARPVKCDAEEAQAIFDALERLPPIMEEPR